MHVATHSRCGNSHPGNQARSATFSVTAHFLCARPLNGGLCEEGVSPAGPWSGCDYLARSAAISIVTEAAVSNLPGDCYV